MTARILSFLKDEAGHSTTEYALLAAFLSVAIAGSLAAMGSNTSVSYNAVSGKVVEAAYVACVGAGETPFACRTP
jgi:Flp pilus assembly pilin Flp